MRYIERVLLHTRKRATITEETEKSMGADLLRTASYLTLSVLVVGTATRHAGAANKPDIYICADTTRQITSSQRMLVYTYIDGKKTECMEKHALLVYYAKKTGGAAPAAPKEDPTIEKMKDVVDSLKAEAKDGKDYAGRKLRGRDFHDANLLGADFREADLRSADFRGAILRGADLSGANLSAAFFKDADLRGADLTDAALQGAFLNGANLRDRKSVV